MIAIASLHARSKSNFANLYIPLFTSTCTCTMFDNNFIVKHKDVKILKKLLVEKKEIPGTVLHSL